MDAIARRHEVSASSALSQRFLVYLLLWLLPVYGCATRDPLFAAVNSGFAIDAVPGRGFTHTVLRRTGSRTGSPLHIYIEGDGIPWDMGVIPASDPTPRNALALRLAALDEHDVIYVGRPCYFGHAADIGCEASLWTSGRYGEEVLASMAAVIEAELAIRAGQPYVLIGFSGGGTLATLLGNRISDARAVLTVAAVLDIDAWTEHHQYDPLTGSINPMLEARKGREILHVQLIGSADTVVPPFLTHKYRAQHPDTVVWSYDNFDHACCWESQWPAIVERFYELIGRRRAEQAIE